MVHTEPVTTAHLPHLPQIGGAAFSSEGHYLFMRPRHADFPDNAVRRYGRKAVRKTVLPDHVMRVAVADDADPFVDMGLAGVEAERRRWMRGRWEDGRWFGEEVADGQLVHKVVEGRVLGYAVWARHWPDKAEHAKSAMGRGAARAVWPADTWWKRFERAAFGLEDWYTKRFCPDPAESAERWALLARGDGHVQFLKYAGPVMARCAHVGFIFLDTIAVDPSFHRKGVGARLMRWGLERAETEGCPILLVASGTGSRLYEKVGFDTLGAISLPGLTGDCVMVYWPKAFEDVQKAVVDAVDGAKDASDAVAVQSKGILDGV